MAKPIFSTSPYPTMTIKESLAIPQQQAEDNELIYSILYNLKDVQDIRKPFTIPLSIMCMITKALREKIEAEKKK